MGEMARYLWNAPRDDAGHERQWRLLLEHACASADEVRFAMSARGPSIMRLDGRPPFVHVGRAVDAASILGRMRERLGQPVSVYDSPRRWGCEQSFETTFVHYSMTPTTRDYLLGSVSFPEAWAQQDGLPEDPTLLADGRVILETISDEPVVYVTGSADELDALRRKGIELTAAAEETAAADSRAPGADSIGPDGRHQGA